MTTLAQSQAISVTAPALVAYIVVDGALTDPFSLGFVVYERVTSRASRTRVYPVSGAQAVDLVADRLGTGRFAATWAVASNAKLGDYEIVWTFTFESGGPSYTYAQPFEVVKEVWDAGGRAYATVQSFRDEGVTVGAISDAKLYRKILAASQLFELYTERTFVPEALTVKLDGNGGKELLLRDPIIALESIALTSDLVVPSVPSLDLSAIKVYNRHITEGLRNPDDRESPRIAWAEDGIGSYSGYGYNGYDRARWTADLCWRWPRGTQNVIITGLFGYTEANGTPTGGVPQQVARAVQLLTLRDLPALTDTAAREDANRWRLTGERTRDQAYTMLNGTDIGQRRAAIGSFTGDPAIDGIIEMFKRPFVVGGA
jgi:hypothetical protein